MSEKNESVAEVPEEGNSAGFFTEQAEVTETKTKKTSWPWAAVAATAIVAGVGGYAFGQTNGFGPRPVGAHEQFGGTGVQGGMPSGGQMGPGDADGNLSGMHCHDANGQDTAVGTDGKCADGSTPGGMMNGKMGPRGGHHGAPTDTNGDGKIDEKDDPRGTMPTPTSSATPIQ